MHICITGARGRLGSILTELLEKDGHEVVRFSRNADAKFACLSNLANQIHNATDVVLHLAWSTVPASSENNPGIEWHDDLPLLAAIASECLSSAKSPNGMPLLVFFSSCSVYGDLPAGRSTAFSESDRRNPKGWYASAKSAAEDLLERFSLNGLRCLILRVSNPFGFSQSPACLQGLIPFAIAAAQQGSELQIWGDGKATKDFLDIRDLYSALMSALHVNMTGTFNICSGQSTSIDQVVKTVENVLQNRIASKHGIAAPWDVQSALYSNLAFKERSGWSPRFSLEQGIRDFVGSS
jgi:UDP-glucose 4-epimerase